MLSTPSSLDHSPERSATERPLHLAQGVDRPTHRVAVCFITVALALSACGGGTQEDVSATSASSSPERSESPTPTESPSPAADLTPAEVLQAISLPTDKAEIKAVIWNLPDEVAGRAKAFASLPLLRAGYGEGKHQILILACEAFDLDLSSKTAGEFIPLSAASEAMNVDASALDPDGDVVFFVGAELPGGPGQFKVKTPIAFFGEPDSRWVFVAIADTPESLADLIEAFSIAAGSGG